MTEVARTLMVCSCEDTMPLDGAALQRGCKGAGISQHRHLCRSQIERFQEMLAKSEAITVACTQEAPLFEEVAADLDYAGDLVFANIRESAGWSKEARAAGPKMAALLAAASEPLPPASFTTLTSMGVALVYGRDEGAIALAQRLAEHLDVTVLLARPGEIAPPRLDAFPVLKGTIGRATGWLGAFEVSWTPANPVDASLCTGCNACLEACTSEPADVLEEDSARPGLPDDPERGGKEIALVVSTKLLPRD